MKQFIADQRKDNHQAVAALTVELARLDNDIGALKVVTVEHNALMLAAITEMKRLKLDQRATRLGEYLRTRLPVRGKGLMLGLPVGNAPRLCEKLLQCGVIALPEGTHNEVLGITPPLVITERQLDYFLKQLD